MIPAIAVVGSLNMDFVVTVGRLPAPGETVLGSSFRMVPGGKGANQAFAAAKLAGDSFSVRMVGRVGYDHFADYLKAGLAAVGVDVSAVHATQAQPTGVALICVDPQGRNSIVVAPGANLELADEDVEGLRGAFRDARFALFQLESPLKTVEAALALARRAGAQTILDPAPAQPLRPQLLHLVDILTPNETEACLLVGRSPEPLSRPQAERVSAALLEQGPRSVVLKLGSLGCLYRSRERTFYAPAFPVAAVDTTAAGDTFNAALAVSLAEGKDLEAALRFANAASAISVTRPGAQTSAPSRPEVDQLISRAGSP